MKNIGFEIKHTTIIGVEKDLKFLSKRFWGMSATHKKVYNGVDTGLTETLLRPLLVEFDNDDWWQ